MAVVKMHQIKSTPVKALAYIARPDATSDGLWVSTNAAVIDPSDFKAVAREFARTAERVGVSTPRDGSVLAHHIIQSFDPAEEMTAEVAHSLGIQLVENFTGGQFEYMIATHLDKGHVHNHIIVNAVNMETGRKLRVQKNTLAGLRASSDALCLAEGLAVLPPPEKRTGKSFADIYRVLKGDSAKEVLRTEIDRAASTAHDWNEFESILFRAGIEVSLRGGRTGRLSFREAIMGRPVRDFRLGASYTEQSIMARLSKRVVNMVGVDASMIVKETRDTVTVNVPGSRRQLTMTVAKKQIVRHGRALRIYVPVEEKHALADRSGRLSRSVSTNGLYDYFSRPVWEQAATEAKRKQSDPSAMAGWGATLDELRELQQVVDAKARWMRPQSLDAESAAEDASRALEEKHWAYQTVLVAVTEIMADPAGDSSELPPLQAELRLIERDLTRLREDVQALTSLVVPAERKTLAQQIETRVAANQARVWPVEPSPHVGREATPDPADQAVPPAIDEDEGSLTLAARIEKQIKARQEAERHTQKNEDDGPRGRPRST